MRKIDYNRQTIDSANPIARYTHRSRHRRALAVAGCLLPPGGRIVDFGCGVGSFLNELKAHRPDADLVGYDPGQFGTDESFTRVSHIDAVYAASVDVLCAFEVLEHLSDEQVVWFIDQTRRVLKPGGTIVVSVPIVGGLTLPLRELNRMIMFRRSTEYSFGEFLRASFLGIPPERPSDRGPTHKGFDFRVMHSILAATFNLRTQLMCPFSGLPWWLNSQAFFVLEST